MQAVEANGHAESFRCSSTACLSISTKCFLYRLSHSLLLLLFFFFSPWCDEPSADPSARPPAVGSQGLIVRSCSLNNVGCQTRKKPLPSSAWLTNCFVWLKGCDRIPLSQNGYAILLCFFLLIWLCRKDRSKRCHPCCLGLAAPLWARAQSPPCKQMEAWSCTAGYLICSKRCQVAEALEEVTYRLSDQEHSLLEPCDAYTVHAFLKSGVDS